MLRRFRHGIRTVRAFGRIPPKTLPEPILALRSQRRRRTALPRQTARVRTSIPASQDKTPAFHAARHHLCTAADLPNAPTCLRSQRRLHAAGILPIHARIPFTAASPHSFRPGIRSPTPTQDYTRRTAPSRQTALRTHAPRARASIPASRNKTPGTSRRPASPARRRNPSDTRPCPVHSGFAALFPARHPLAHAHARLYPPHGPVTSNSSPHAYTPGASFDSSVSGQNSRHFAPPGITYVPPQLFRTLPRVSVHSVACAPPESFPYTPASRSQRLRRALPSQASAHPRPRKIIPAARPRHIKQLPARVHPGHELRFQRFRTKLPALHPAQHYPRAAGILPIHARAPFTATSPHSFRPDIRSPTPTRDCTRRTAP